METKRNRVSAWSNEDEKQFIEGLGSHSASYANSNNEEKIAMLHSYKAALQKRKQCMFDKFAAIALINQRIHRLRHTNAN